MEGGNRKIVHVLLGRKFNVHRENSAWTLLRVERAINSASKSKWKPARHPWEMFPLSKGRSAPMRRSAKANERRKVGRKVRESGGERTRKGEKICESGDVQFACSSDCAD